MQQKLSAGWGIELDSSLTVYGIDIEKEIMEVMSAEITLEMDREILEELKRMGIYDILKKQKKNIHER